MTQYGFHFNGARCTGCKTCAMACKDKNDLPPELGFRNVYEYTGGSWNQEGDLWTNDVYSYYMSVACNHCDSPACVEICPQRFPRTKKPVPLFETSKLVSVVALALRHALTAHPK